MKKVALIAGVGGMCGGNMARMLHDTGEWDVIGVSRGDPELGDWVRHIPVDLLDREATLKALAEVKGVTHIFSPRCSTAAPSTRRTTSTAAWPRTSSTARCRTHRTCSMCTCSKA
jgi:nucleoside-diphosphate-sugar epimerase